MVAEDHLGAGFWINALSRKHKAKRMFVIFDWLFGVIFQRLHLVSPNSYCLQYVFKLQLVIPYWSRRSFMPCPSGRVFGWISGKIPLQQIVMCLGDLIHRLQLFPVLLSFTCARWQVTFFCTGVEKLLSHWLKRWDKIHVAVAGCMAVGEGRNHFRAN